MLKPFGRLSLLLVTSALVTPSLALAQAVEEPAEAGVAEEGATEQPVEAAADALAVTEEGQDEGIDVSIPGGEIVVQGRRLQNVEKAAPQVVSLLSSADIARTGEGDIAGALGRVTGLSVVGNGYVYVRGLGDRYSLALLNGSPLPSPEPLRRVVPLDLFPTKIGRAHV